MRPRRWKIDIQFFSILSIFFVSAFFPPEIYFISRIIASFLILNLGYAIAMDQRVSFQGSSVAVFTCIVLFLLLNCFLSFSPYSSMNTMCNFLLLFIIFLIFYKTVTFSQFMHFLTFLTVVASGVSLYGIYQHFFGFEKLADFLHAKGGLLPGIFLAKIESGRVFSTFVLPAALAGYLLMTIPLCFFLLIFSKNKKRRVLFAFLLVLQCTALLLSFSLGALIALFLSLFVVAWFKFRRRLTMVFALLFIFFVAAVFFLSYRGIYLSEFFDPDSPLVLRLGNWKASLLMFRDHPLFGVGNGSFGVAFSQYREPWMNESHFAHNTFLQLIAENGIFAVFCLVVFLSLLRKHMLKAWVIQDSSRLGLKPFISFSCLAFLMHNLFDFTFYLPSVSFVFFSLLGMMFGTAGNSHEGVERRTFSKLMFIALLTLASLFFLSSFLGDYHFERAQNLRESGKFDKADSMLRKAELFSPFQSEYRIYRAQLLIDKENPAQDRMNAIDEAMDAISLDPFIPYYYSVLSDIYTLKGEPLRAYSAISKAAELYPADKNYRMRKDMIWKILDGQE